MIFNETAAAYGFFQIVFSDVVDHLAAATFLLRKLREPKLDFKEVFRQNVSRTLLQFETELTQFDGRPSMKDDLDDLRAACKIISTLMKWRNDRIHARVAMIGNAYALYDWRDGRPLEIHRDVIVELIHDAYKVIRALVEIVRPLTRQSEFDFEVALEKLFKSMPEFAEAEDDDAGSATA